ncbi:CHAD domain-containing protein [Streptomyces sp. NPDC008313]|uniref:CHAD domain-containing protein n=1 Tax=Streptomyces sp. NPDC008313 TaxID=3364826 RepID=UPI0036F14346
MAQRHLDPTEPIGPTEPEGLTEPVGPTGSVGREPFGSGPGGADGGPVGADALAGYLRAQATEFLRSLRLHREAGGESGATGRVRARAGENGPAEPVDAVRALRRSARRISGTLHTFRPLLDPGWSEAMRPELAWLSGTLAHEHACAARLERLLTALHRLSGSPAVPLQPAAAPPASGTLAVASGAASGRADRGTSAGTAVTGATADGGAVTVDGTPVNGGTAAPTPPRGSLTVGAAKAGALLDRQLSLARSRAHSAALQALGSSRFHAVADSVAVLASEVPLTPAAAGTDPLPLAAAAEERLRDAVAALPLLTAGHPYNAEALVHGLSPDTAPHPQDAPWHQVRLLLRLHRYALEALHDDRPASGPHGGGPLRHAGEALDRHRDAAEAAAAAASAARTPRIAPATAYALGVLHADQRHEVEAARFAFQQSWLKEAVNSR